MKILHVIGSSEFGGIIPYVEQICIESDRRGHSSFVIATNPRVVEYFSERGIAVINFSGINRKIGWEDLYDLVRLVKYLNQNTYDVVHTHTSKGGIVGRISAYIARVPKIVHSCQGYAFKDYAKSYISKFIFYCLELLCGHLGDQLIVVNQTDFNVTRRLNIAPFSRVSLIPNGIKVTNSPEERVFLSSSKCRLLFVGRLSEQKGILDMIRIFGKLSKSKFTLDIVGDGPQFDECVQLVEKLNLSEHINFHGFLSDFDELVQNSNIFVMPSHWEGMPMTLLYILSQGLPVIASNIKGINDICTNNITALLCDYPYVDSFVEAINILANDSELQSRLSANGREHILDHFTASKCSEAIVDLYL